MKIQNNKNNLQYLILFNKETNKNEIILMPNNNKIHTSKLLLNGIAFKVEQLNIASFLSEENGQINGQLIDKKSNMKKEDEILLNSLKNWKLATGNIGSVFNSMNKKIFTLSKNNWNKQNIGELKELSHLTDKTSLKAWNITQNNTLNLSDSLNNSWNTNYEMDLNNKLKEYNPSTIKMNLIQENSNKDFTKFSKLHILKIKSMLQNRFSGLAKLVNNVIEKKLNPLLNLNTNSYPNQLLTIPSNLITYLNINKTKNILLPKNLLLFKVGYSHLTLAFLSNLLKLNMINPTKLEVSSNNKQLLFQQLNNFIQIKKRDVYKGKGIFLQGQKLVLKTKKN